MSEELTEEPQFDLGRLEKIRSRMRIISNESGVDDVPVEQIRLPHRDDILREARAAKWDEKVPPRWAGWNLETMPKPLQREAVDWIQNDFPSGRNMILMGPTGSGKTSIAYAVAREMFLSGYKTKIWQTAELLEKIRPSDTQKVVFESAKTCQLLVLDDLGVEKDSEWTEERIFLILDYRWQWNLPTIISTNLSEEQFSVRISDRIYSRIHDGAKVLVIQGKDYRAEPS